MARSISKENMILDIVERAGKRISDHYIRKIVARKTVDQVTTIYRFMQENKVSPKFAYMALTAGLYE